MRDSTLAHEPSSRCGEIPLDVMLHIRGDRPPKEAIIIPDSRSETSDYESSQELIFVNRQTKQANG
jgi:hypothetical protein